MPKSNVVAGKLGEDAALRLLKIRGYKLLARNFHSRFGEIDIIAKDGNTLVFVEVKTRWSKRFGTPEEAVTSHKLQSIIRTGEYFKLQNPNTPDLMRVDVVAVEVEGSRVASTRIIKNVTG